jgi:hypothetical protein
VEERLLVLGVVDVQGVQILKQELQIDTHRYDKQVKYQQQNQGERINNSKIVYV